MPEYTRALIVILALATVVFVYTKKLATANAMSIADFERRRNIWLLITVAGFLSQSFLVFASVVTVTIFFTKNKEQNKIALFFFVLLAIPLIQVEIPGFGGIRYFISVDYFTVIAILLLLPVAVECRRISVRRNNKIEVSDVILTIYIVYSVILVSRQGDLIAIIRSLIGIIINTALPYYAISRYVTDIKKFREVLMAFVVASMLSASVATFEFSRSWMLYNSIGEALSLEWSTGYLVRGSNIRAVSSSAVALVLGYVMTVAMGIYFYFYTQTSSTRRYIFGFILLIAGSIASLSKGPWLGFALFLLIYLALGPSPIKKITNLFFLGLLFVSTAALTGKWGVIADYIPFVGGVDSENLIYRKNLLDVSINIIAENPVFGSTNFLTKMEIMRNGDGLIDLVNHYIGLTLYSGLIGLFLFMTFFISILYRLFKLIKKLNASSEMHLLARMLFSMMLSVLFMISSVSSISHVPILYYSIAALGLALIRMNKSLLNF